ncbi:hypothetical protein [Nocardioides sp.]|uniref:hypothetical protein n=1 Tax=Nocardioides sp. TaxID=35761 RepID=UPI003518EF69
MRRDTVTSLTLAALAGILLSTGGCSADAVAERAAEEAIERSLEDAGGGSASVDVDLDAGGVTVDDGQGNTLQSGTGAEIPDDFPADIPLVDGLVVSGLSTTDTTGSAGWNVNLDLAGADPRSVRDEAVALLEDAGYVSTSSTDFGETLGEVMVGPQWQVAVSIIGQPTSTTVSYLVTTAAP